MSAINQFKFNSKPYNTLRQQNEDAAISSSLNHVYNAPNC